MTLIGKLVLPPEVVLRLGGGDLQAGHELLDLWVAGVRDVIAAEKRVQEDFRTVLDETNCKGVWEIDGGGEAWLLRSILPGQCNSPPLVCSVRHLLPLAWTNVEALSS